MPRKAGSIDCFRDSGRSEMIIASGLIRPAVDVQYSQRIGVDASSVPTSDFFEERRSLVGHNLLYRKPLHGQSSTTMTGEQSMIGMSSASAHIRT